MKDQWIDWLQVKRRHFFYGVIFVVAGFFIAFQIAGHLSAPKFRKIHRLGALDLSGSLPSHTAFAKTSKLIAQNNLKDALVESLALKGKLQKDSLLYGFNLVRIASLARTLESAAEEQAALIELQGYLDTHRDAESTLSECFREGNLNLRDYIESRKVQ